MMLTASWHKLTMIKTHKDKYKDKEKRKLPRRKGSCIKAKLLCVAIYLWIHQSFAQFTMSSFKVHSMKFLKECWLKILVT